MPIRISAAALQARCRHLTSLPAFTLTPRSPLPPPLTLRSMSNTSTTGAASGPASASSTPPLPGNAPSAAGGAAPASASSPSTSSESQTQPTTSTGGDGAIPQQPQPPKALPALPSPEDAAAGGSSDGLRTVHVNGQPIALDNLGPMVVGRDGVVSRIANWGEMTALERENTLRILCKRNQLRLANLRAGRPADEKPEDQQAEAGKKE
ncbi:hypothetical protein VTI74DRAFT_1124 [Chaetomium olivicolor]